MFNFMIQSGFWWRAHNNKIKGLKKALNDICYSLISVDTAFSMFKTLLGVFWGEQEGIFRVLVLDGRFTASIIG
jgi:hypothetical protein